MRRISATGLLLFILTMTQVSCDKNMVYDTFLRTGDNTWEWDEPLDFRFTMEDTVQYHDILLQLRHTTDYPMSNIYMFVRVEGPSGQALTDTVNLVLAKKSGEWIGKGIGQVRTIAYMYRKNTIFPTPGEYRISLEQAMRSPELPVTEAGVRIIRSTP